MSFNDNNNKIKELLSQIRRFTELDFDARGKTVASNDPLNEITDALNALGEKLRSRKENINNDKERMESLLNILLKYTMMDFSEKAAISEKGDELDAIAAGVNALVEELEYKIKEIKENEERFRLLIENVKDYAIYLIDINGNIISWNKGAQNIKGYTEEEIIGKNFSIFYTGEELENNEPKHNLKMAGELGHYECEGWRLKKDGSRFWAKITFTAMYDHFGNVTGFSKITRDVTEQKAAELSLKEKSEELSRSNAELEQFAYVASHDLQEPLRMVTSYVQLLEKRYKDKLDEDANEFINYAVDGSIRMRVLINSLLEYSRVNRVKPFEKIYMNELMGDILQNLKGQITENNAAIKVNNLPDIIGDPILINQLFQNLISNAIKFKGEKAPEIIISGEKLSDEYLFSVKDNGIGIKKEYAEKIFVIFQRLHSKEKYPGTGIGLAICKKIVERHNGRIWMESEAGKGSTFYFTIRTQ